VASDCKKEKRREETQKTVKRPQNLTSFSVEKVAVLANCRPKAYSAHRGSESQSQIEQTDD
jgi:hypothetical protein